MTFRSLSARLLLAFALVQAGSMVIWALFLTFGVHLRGLFPRESDLHLMRHLAAELGATGADPLAQQRRLEVLSTQLALDLVWLDASGAPLHAAGGPVALPSRWRPPAGEAVFVSGWSPLFAAPVPVLGGHVVSAPASLLTPLPLRMVLAIGAMWLLTAVVFVPVSRSFTGPLRRLEAAAVAFGRGDGAARVGLTGDDELGRLGQAFDQMAARVAAARRAERELLANASHELKTPLARLRMVLVLVDRSSPAVARRLDALEADVAELGHIVADLLDVSRLDLAPETLRREPVSLEALVDKLAAQVRVVEPARAVEGRGLAGLQWVGDPVLLARALGNLVENARRYDRSGAPIVVEAQVRGPQRVLRVIDQGPGVPEAEREALFEPFRRGAARDDGQGSGLGLTLVRRIARAHGGDATLEANPAGGTVAVLALPAERPPAAPQAPL